MAKSNKQKTTAEVSLKSSLSNWQDLVYRYEQASLARDYKFWEESWNDECED
jgi:hypothetical protein